ncbi:glutamate racemase [Pseudovibrio sp. SPO723]|uniref:glutamate racemase n=1 Tax=Nesiotobacter zosterae TaxID=392721 RepID=UPI0029C37C9F|nr:glutamate racemase [Pseudovibrio sp. SPO723]MDX5594180.1 glutamate racemase [Pseudovibrio sp. SPO723]
MSERQSFVDPVTIEPGQCDVAGRIMVFDSGIGGLTVARQIQRNRPNEGLLYVADDLGFPYGDWQEGALGDHIEEVVARFAAKWQPSALVIACNTASTLVLPRLRARFSFPIVGTVPAIKPAAEKTLSGVVAVLATPGTVRRDYTRDLISKFANGVQVELVGATRIAQLAEDKMAGRDVDTALLRQQISPCFVEYQEKRTDCVVLGCTHYPFLLEELEQIAPWPVAWIDPSPAVARQLDRVLAQGAGAECTTTLYRYTSGRDFPSLIF